MLNRNKNKKSSMVWMMFICILPLVVLLFAGGKLFSDGYLWPVFIGIFVIAHIWMMFKGHGGCGGRGNADVEEKSDVVPEKQSEAKGEHKHNGDCH